MKLRGIRDSSMAELNIRSGAFMAACGYEHRSPQISGLVTGAPRRIAMCFNEWPDALARKQNERVLKERGFAPVYLSGNDSPAAEQIVSEVATPVFVLGKRLRSIFQV